MKAFWNFIFRRIPIVKQLDGHKTRISTALTMLGLLLELINLVPVIFPQMQMIFDITSSTAQFLQQIDGWLLTVGITGLPIGLFDKYVKKKNNP